MAIFNRGRTSQQRSSNVGVTCLRLDSPGVLSGSGYHRMCDAPEVASAIWIIADLISSMPIHLLEKQKTGDKRIRDALSRKIDVDPWSLSTRRDWVHWIVQTMLTEGEAVVIPQTVGLQISDLTPAPDATLFRPTNSYTYFARYKGQEFAAGNILHFKLRPDPSQPWRGIGPRVQLENVVESIIQTAGTKTAYMSSEYKPPIVVSVNSDSPLSDEKERSKFTKKYLKRSDPSEPWIIPADLMTVTQVKPLSLTDLAIKDGIELDKKTVAAVLDVPAFLLGVGAFNKDEYNTWISRRLMSICRAIEQELTKKILSSEDRYFRFNARSLYSYSLQELSQIALNMRNAGLMTGNEGRNWMDLPPMDGLDELVMLENYIPADRLGDQAKLKTQTGEKEASTNV